MRVVTLNGREIDLDKAFPLTIGDWRALKKRGVTPTSLKAGTGDPDDIAALTFHVLHKADATVTEAEVDALTFTSPVFRELMAAMKESAEQDGATDRPS